MACARLEMKRRWFRFDFINALRGSNWASLPAVVENTARSGPMRAGSACEHARESLVVGAHISSAEFDDVRRSRSDLRFGYVDQHCFDSLPQAFVFRGLSS